MQHEGILFKVEHLDPLLITRNGRYGFYGYDTARRLEKMRKGKIMSEGHLGGGVDLKVLEAGGSGKYLVKAGFKGTGGERTVLGRKDLYGDQEG